ncbi:hypothetical protein V2G26_001758 [Clonostachys chloroleuca]
MEAPRRSISRLTLTAELTSLFVIRIGDKCDADLAVSRCDKHFTAALIGLFSVTTSDPSWSTTQRSSVLTGDSSASFMAIVRLGGRHLGDL